MLKRLSGGPFRILRIFKVVWRSPGAFPRPCVLYKSLNPEILTVVNGYPFEKV